MSNDREKVSKRGSDSDVGPDVENDARGDSKDRDVDTAQDAGPPDGGKTAWLVVLGAWCCSFSSPGWVNSVGSFQQYYKVGPLKEYSTSTISWIPSLQIFFLFAMGPIVGVLYDRYGPRPLIIGGTLVHVFGLMMASLATEYYQFLLAQGVCSASGVSFIYLPALACVSTFFSKRRGLAMGVLTTGSSIGGVIFPIMISRMVKSTGYGWTMRTAAFIILALQSIAIFTVRSRTKPLPKRVPAGRFAAPLKEVPFLLLMLGIFVLTFGIFIPLSFLAQEAYDDAQVSADLAQYLVAIFNGASLFGRLSTGFVADLMGRWNMFILACALSGIAELAVWIPATTPSIAIGFAIFFGFASGAFVGLSAALPISVSPPDEIGYRLGITYLALSIPALVLGPVGGAILQSSSWLNVKIFGGIMCLAGSAIVLSSRVLYTDKKLLKVF